MTPLLLALDPSFTATGAVVVDVVARRVVAAACIRTAPPKASERLTSAEANASRGSYIRREVTALCEAHRPFLAVQEGNAGSKSAKSAAALARAQQACVDGVEVALGAAPVIVTPQSVKKATCGAFSASKDDLERAALEWWGEDLRALVESVRDPRTGRPVPGSKHENIYDAACVAASIWDRPEVAALRRLAGDS